MNIDEILEKLSLYANQTVSVPFGNVHSGILASLALAARPEIDDITRQHYIKVAVDLVDYSCSQIPELVPLYRAIKEEWGL